MKAFAIRLFFFAATLTIQAQEYPHVELYAGATYENIDLGSQVAIFNPGGANFGGFDLSMAVNPKRRFGILSDLTFQFGHTNEAPLPPFTKIYLETT